MSKQSDYSLEYLRASCKKWRQCDHHALSNGFHIAFVDEDISSPSWYYRKNCFQLPPEKIEDFKTQIAEDHAQIRVHMAFGEHNDQEGFFPILQVSSELRPDPTEASFVLDLHYKHSSRQENVWVPEAFKTQMCQSWLRLHPGYLADQFTVLEAFDPSATPGRALASELSIPCRKRVLHFTFGVEDVNHMRKQEFAAVFLHLGINHNHDDAPEPSFIPILQLAKKENFLSNGEGDDFYEYATPCPPLC
ncbi:MAG: hypothetical protein AAFQ87_23680 [Bacteroidota bacterium]